MLHPRMSEQRSAVAGVADPGALLGAARVTARSSGLTEPGYTLPTDLCGIWVIGRQDPNRRDTFGRSPRALRLVRKQPAKRRWGYLQTDVRLPQYLRNLLPRESTLMARHDRRRISLCPSGGGGDAAG
jgi:hypothetical protein